MNGPRHSLEFHTANSLPYSTERTGNRRIPRYKAVSRVLSMEGRRLNRSLLCPFPRTSRIAFLARLRVRQRPAFEFAFRLEPIVQFAARLFAAFKIDFVCAKFDFLLTRRVPRQSILRPRRRGVGCLGPYTFVPLSFRSHTLLPLP